MKNRFTHQQLMKRLTHVLDAESSDSFFVGKSLKQIKELRRHARELLKMSKVDYEPNKENKS